jgi:hypothetical protein
LQLYDQQSERWKIVGVRVSKQLLELAQSHEISQIIARNIFKALMTANPASQLESWSWTES